MTEQQREPKVTRVLQTAVRAYEDAADVSEFLELCHAAVKGDRRQAEIIVREIGGTERRMKFDSKNDQLKVIELLLDLAHARAFLLKQELRDSCRDRIGTYITR